VIEWLDQRAVGLAVALGLGLLVGAQREWVADKPIGIRSFALIGLMGGLVGFLTDLYGGWILAAGLLAVTAATFAHSLLRTRGEPVGGMTTELAAIVLFLVGALATLGFVLPAVVIGGVVTLLLHWKSPLHRVVERLGESDAQAIARFILVTLVVLPALPNRAFGPYDVLNPWQIWLMVVLIVSLNLAGYVALRLFRGRRGALMSGVLGGLISSTATTVAFATRTRREPGAAQLALVVILIASALVYIRILIETAAVAPDLLPSLAGPATVFLLLFVLVVALRLARFEADQGSPLPPDNPAELSTAVGFGALYSVVLLASAAVDEHLGEQMLYGVAIVSGLTDVDAITLSTAWLYLDSRISADTAWRVIALASLANLGFKGGIVAVLGGPSLRRALLPTMIGLTVAGLAGVAFWP
jgi:uncharacterized membrane protein (DUF4010 family)